MKKVLYKLLYICLITIVFIIINNTKVQAASASLTASTLEPTEGQTVNVTASVTAGAWNLQFEGNGKSETIYGFTQANANASDSKTITFTAGGAGTKYTFSLKGDMTDITSDASEQVNKTITITVKAPVVETPDPKPTPEPEKPAETKKSSEARLKNFGIKPKEYDFSGFSKNPDKEEWSTEVPNKVTSVDVYADPKDSKAKVTGHGKVTLNEGNNKIGVKVTAEDGTTKTYYLSIKRKTAAEEKAEEESKNGENRLKSLSIKPKEYDFSGFDSEKTEYAVEVPNEVEQIEIIANAMDSKAQITGTGMIDLTEGKNELKIEVIAVNGDKKTYTLTVTRLEAEEKEIFGLSVLSINGLQLNPTFKTATYEYKVTIEEDLSELEITAKANVEDAKIEIVGNENLQQGENTITILVKNEETKEVATYQIIVNKNVVATVAATVQKSWLKPSTWGKEEFIKIVIIIVLIILIICAILLKKNISKESKELKLADLPGADELDKAITEHQELVQEENFMQGIIGEKNKDVNNNNEQLNSDIKNDEEINYIEQISKERFGDINEKNSEKPKRRGRHF